MKKRTYLVINIIVLLIVGRQIVIDFQNIKNNIIEMLIASLIAIVIINFLLFLTEKISEAIYNSLEKRNSEKYNMLDWLGEQSWITLHENLSKIKDFDKTSLILNVNSVKEEIKKEYDTKEKLEILRIYLENKVESPKLQTLNTATYTILIAIITTTVVSFINGLLDFNSTIYLIYLFIFVFIWLLLLASINFISKQIDKNKILLKIVIQCINEISDSES